jgi:ribosomal protein L21E
MPGLLNPLPVPVEAWSTISLDFVEGLPKSGAYNCILVVIDKFTKYGHFIPLSHPYTALTVAQKFVDTIYRLHGLPNMIISDRDPIFTSKIWQELFRLTDTKMNMSSAHHPQTDGQTEKLNQCLETYLRCAVHASPKQWSQWLPLAKYWYNTNHHSALGKTPFQVLYGYTPRHLGISNLQSSTPPDLAGWLQFREETTTLLHHHLLRAQQRMKAQEDKHRSEREFQVGDMVYVKLQPYTQTSIAQRANRKLFFKFFGPYEIISRIGKVAYRLKLPDGSQIHHVLHVSQLKKCVPSTQVHDSDLNFQFITNECFMVQPLHILASRTIKRGLGFAEQVQVAWTGLPSTLSTWESEAALRARFPQAPA